MLIVRFDSQVLVSVPCVSKTVFQIESTHYLDLSSPHPELWECPSDCEEFIRSRPQGPGDIWACQRSHLSLASTLTLPFSISLPRPHPRLAPRLDQGHLSLAAQPNPAGASCQQGSLVNTLHGYTLCLLLHPPYKSTNHLGSFTPSLLSSLPRLLRASESRSQLPYM